MSKIRGQAPFISARGRVLVGGDSFDNSSGMVAEIDVSKSAPELAGSITTASSVAHIDDNGELIVVAHCAESCVSVIRGTFESIETLRFAGNGPHPRQDRSHPHGSLLTNGYLLIADHGADRVHVMRREGGSFHRASSWVAPAGSGPRDLVAHEAEFWLLTELEGALHRLRLEGGELSEVQAPVRLATASEHDNLSAGIAVMTSGIVLTGNRIQDDLVTFEFGSGRLQRTDLPGWPRQLSLSADEKTLAIALEDIGQIQVLTVAADGTCAHESVIELGGAVQSVRILDTPSS